MEILDNQMGSFEPQKVRFVKQAAIVGSWITLISVIYGLLTYLADFSDAIIQNKTLGTVNNILQWGIVFVVIFWGIKKHKKEDLRGWMSIGRGTGFGAMAGLVAGALSIVWTYVFFELISPETLELIQQRAMQDMADRGMSESDIETQMEIARPFMQTPFICVITFVFSIIMGVLSGLISGAILQKK